MFNFKHIQFFVCNNFLNKTSSFNIASVGTDFPLFLFAQWIVIYE